MQGYTSQRECSDHRREYTFFPIYSTVSLPELPGHYLDVWKQCYRSCLLITGLSTLSRTSKNHRRIVAANLVQGAYNLERTRRRGSNYKPEIEKAEAIGERLGFEILERHEATDGTYVAIVYNYKYAPQENCDPEISPPKYAIAFRGSYTKRDFISNVEFTLHELHKSSRFKQAVEVVQKIISMSGGPKNVWLAGHSLGSAIALMVGRNMVINNDCHLNTYLFNPPFVAYSNLKPFRHIYSYGRSFLTAGVESIVRLFKPREKSDEVFEKLKTWKPNLFVNNRDYICNGYISYFKQRKRMQRIGAGKIENRATQNSVISLLGEVMDEDFEPVHLIPSASLTTTKGSYGHLRKNHGIKQWWENTDLPIQNKSYVFNQQ